MTAEQETALRQEAAESGEAGEYLLALLDERRAMKEALEAFMIPKDQLARPLSVIELKARAALALAEKPLIEETIK